MRIKGIIYSLKFKYRYMSRAKKIVIALVIYTVAYTGFGVMYDYYIRSKFDAEIKAELQIIKEQNKAVLEHLNGLGSILETKGL